MEFIKIKTAICIILLMAASCYAYPTDYLENIFPIALLEQEKKYHTSNLDALKDFYTSQDYILREIRRLELEISIIDKKIERLHWKK